MKFKYGQEVVITQDGFFEGVRGFVLSHIANGTHLSTHTTHPDYMVKLQHGQVIQLSETFLKKAPKTRKE